MIKTYLTSLITLNNQNIPIMLKKLVAGKMKDEICGASVKCFVGFKSKLYIFIRKDKHESEIAKVINKSFIDQELIYEN